MKGIFNLKALRILLPGWTTTCLMLFFFNDAWCMIWQVGPARTYTVPSAVAGLVADGDTVQVDAGLYTDCAVWTKSNLLLQGVGPGYAHCTQSVCGYKGVWVINSGADNITIENMEFSNASISGAEGGNGAGLRAQGGGYTIRHCYFHNNQNGILCNPTAGNDSADVLIEYSVFADNGCATGDSSGCNPGYEHNMYIGSGYRSFTLQYSFTHGAINGHNVKTRAKNNYILYNSIMDLADGTSSYDIDIAQGGPTVIMGNLVEGGPHKVNHSMICYNEGSTNPGPQNLYIVNNTIINDQITGDFLFMPLSTNDTLTLYNNIIAGPGTLFKGSPGFSRIDSGYNLVDSSIAGVGLVNAAAYNYNLTDSSPAINQGGPVSPVYGLLPVSPFSLVPVAEYLDSANTQPRRISGSSIDIGAYEFPQPTGISNNSSPDMQLLLTQNISNSELRVRLVSLMSNALASVHIYDITGKLISSSLLDVSGSSIINTSSWSAGAYLARVSAGAGICSRMFVVSK